MKGKATILIVDDTQYNLKILSNMLSNQGYVVFTASSGIEAIALTKECSPNLILLDIKMPNMDGYQVCSILKKDIVTQHIPIIFISAVENVEEKVEAFSIGGVDFINKPFSLIEVLARVETHLRVSSLQAQLLEQTKLLESQNIVLKEQLSNLIEIDWNLYAEIQKAIELEQMELFYQPIVNFQTNKISGFEALIRWQHPERGLISPIHFIETIESTDLIHPVGQWVIKTACKQLLSWQTEFPNFADLTMSVNVSTKQISDFSLVAYIRQILGKYKIRPSCLKLEITESAVMGDRDRTMQILHQLKEIEVQFCIDDFGTGYSSLRRLTDFPIDILKIDRSFIHNENWVIVKAIGSLAISLGKEIVVEGIETLEQLNILKELFHLCLPSSYGQGYLYAKPLDCLSASQFLEKN